MIGQLSPALIMGITMAYFLLLMVMAYATGRRADNSSFFLAGRQSAWYVVAFGMIGASLSGVTFISVPGWVASKQFSYMQMVLGYIVGYAVIAYVLLPMYYRLQLTSIYTYLGRRFGFWSYKTGAAFFLLSRSLGASFRLYLVAAVMQAFVMDHYGVPFWATVLGTIVLIWVYTFRGGIGTIVWTDTFQTAAMLLAVGLTIVLIGQKLELGLAGIAERVWAGPYSQVFFFSDGWSDPRFFLKQFLSGVFIAIVMTGLDQDMMQKNLSCRNLRDAQKNVMSLAIVLVFVNLLFLSLGALLYEYQRTAGIAPPASSDEVYPLIALQHLSPAVGILFVLGLIAAAYSSADSALTALTTSFCVDFLGFEEKAAAQAPPAEAEAPRPWWALPADPLVRTRFAVHVGFSLVLLLIILGFRAINDRAVVEQVFTVAGYTYGPLLGLYAFGFFTTMSLRDRWAPLVCVLAPVLTFLINRYADLLFFGYKFSFELLLINGLLTFMGLFAISYYDHDEQQPRGLTVYDDSPAK